MGVGAGSSMFLGMVEAPLVIRAYLKNLSRSEFFIVLTAGMSTVAGSIMVLYANVLRGVIDGALGHILIASVINVIGAIVVARVMIPSQRDDRRRRRRGRAEVRQRDGRDHARHYRRIATGHQRWRDADRARQPDCARQRDDRVVRRWAAKR